MKKVGSIWHRTGLHVCKVCIADMEMGKVYGVVVK